MRCLFARFYSWLTVSVCSPVKKSWAKTQSYQRLRPLRLNARCLCQLLLGWSGIYYMWRVPRTLSVCYRKVFCRETHEMHPKLSIACFLNSGTSSVIISKIHTCSSGSRHMSIQPVVPWTRRPVSTYRFWSATAHLHHMKSLSQKHAVLTLSCSSTAKCNRALLWSAQQATSQRSPYRSSYCWSLQAPMRNCHGHTALCTNRSGISLGHFGKYPELLMVDMNIPLLRSWCCFFFVKA